MSGSRSGAHLRQRLSRAVPASAKFILRRSYEVLIERWDRATGRHDPLIPPAHLMFVGGGRANFRALGEKWVQTFIRVAGLRPDEHVLDVGCGVGRMAIGLTGYLSPPGRYSGFDIVQEGIRWCRQTISSRFPNFEFVHADIFNQEYNPRGKTQASEYRFPYPPGVFDFVFLTSVFTHMKPADVRHYLQEIRRVLKPGGRCLITYFLLDEETKALIRHGATGSRSFDRELGGFWVVDALRPEAAIAFEEKAVREFYREAGLMIVEPVLHGAWSGRKAPFTDHSQDIVLATKP